MAEEITKKRLIWKELKKLHQNEKINMVEMSKKVGCSLAYLSALLKFSLESGFIGFHEDGNYIIKNIPSYEKFKKAVNEKYSTYRKSTPSKGRRLSKRLPQNFNFELNQETILAVIKELIRENSELKIKNKKLIQYASKIKKERDELLESFNDID